MPTDVELLAERASRGYVDGTNPTRLLSLRTELQPISLMPRMTAVPVTLARSG